MEQFGTFFTLCGNGGTEERERERDNGSQLLGHFVLGSIRGGTRERERERE